MLGDAETVVRYPTWYLKPETDSRIVREVAYKELERLSEHTKCPDVYSTASAIYHIYRDYKKLEFSIPELLSLYQNVDNRKAERPTVDTIPWDIIPADLIERCFDSEMNLTVTDEILEYLGFSKQNTVFDKYSYTSRYVPKESTITSPTYNDNGELVSEKHLFYDESKGDYKEALVRDPKCYHTTKTPEEIEYVIEMFNKEDNINSLGIRSKLYARVISSVMRCIAEYRKEYFGSSYIERLMTQSVEELRKERVKNEREYAVSSRGKYQEDTSVLWRYGQLAD